MPKQKRANRKRNLERRYLREERAVKELSKHNRKKKKEKIPSKRKSPSEMIEYIPEYLYRPSYFVRLPEDWKSPSFNFSRQIISFVKWIYCSYNPPAFMFNLFFHDLNRATWERADPGADRRLYFKWFLTIASGKSFAKACTNLLTKKEAHIFLNGDNNRSIAENIWRAKYLAAGGSERVISYLYPRLPLNRIDHVNKKYFEMIAFLARFDNEIDRDDLYDVVDYIRAVISNSNFSFKGRTFNSIIKASNEWHKEQQLTKQGRLHFPVKRHPEVDDWAFEDKTEKCTWTVKQLLKSTALYHEGRKMRHCVGSYADRCREGSSFIFSMSVNDSINTPEKLLTIEVDNRNNVIQARGKLNRPPKGKERHILNKWANKFNLRYLW
jgi:hypothetical protein